MGVGGGGLNRICAGNFRCTNILSRLQSEAASAIISAGLVDSVHVAFSFHSTCT